MTIKHEVILFVGGAVFGGLVSAAFAVGWVATHQPAIAVEVQR